MRLPSIVSEVTACYSDKSLYENTDGLNVEVTNKIKLI